MTRPNSKEILLKRLRRSAFQHRVGALCSQQIVFFLGGAMLTFHLGMFGWSLGGTSPQINYPPLAWLWPLGTGLLGILVGAIVSPRTRATVYRAYYEEANSVLLDAGLLEKVTSADAYERLPSLASGSENELQLHNIGYKPGSPRPGSDTFDRRMRDLIRNFDLLKKDIGWMPAPVETKPKPTFGKRAKGCLIYMLYWTAALVLWTAFLFWLEGLPESVGLHVSSGVLVWAVCFWYLGISQMPLSLAAAALRNCLADILEGKEVPHTSATQAALPDAD